MQYLQHKFLSHERTKKFPRNQGLGWPKMRLMLKQCSWGEFWGGQSLRLPCDCPQISLLTCLLRQAAWQADPALKARVPCRLRPQRSSATFASAAGSWALLGGTLALPRRGDPSDVSLAATRETKRHALRGGPCSAPWTSRPSTERFQWSRCGLQLGFERNECLAFGPWGPGGL